MVCNGKHALIEKSLSPCVIDLQQSLYQMSVTFARMRLLAVEILLRHLSSLSSVPPFVSSLSPLHVVIALS